MNTVNENFVTKVHLPNRCLPAEGSVPVLMGESGADVNTLAELHSGFVVLLVIAIG